MNTLLTLALILCISTVALAEDGVTTEQKSLSFEDLRKETLKQMTTPESVTQAMICMEDLKTCEAIFLGWYKSAVGYHLNDEYYHKESFYDFNDYLNRWVQVQLSVGVRLETFTAEEKAQISAALVKVRETMASRKALEDSATLARKNREKAESISVCFWDYGYCP